MKKCLAGTALFTVAAVIGVFSFWNHDDADRGPVDHTATGNAAMPAALPVADPTPAADSKTANVDMPPAAITPAVAATTFQSSAALHTTGQAMASPEGSELGNLARRGRAYLECPDLGVAFDLSPEDESRLYDLLTRQDKDASRAVKNGGFTIEAFGRLQKENEVEIASMLGDKFHRWKEYILEIPSRMELINLRAALEANGSPLSDAQSGPLLRALLAAQQLIYRENGGPDHSPGNIRRYMEAASPYLTPSQLDAYEKMMERQGVVGGKHSTQSR